MDKKRGNNGSQKKSSKPVGKDDFNSLDMDDTLDTMYTNGKSKS